MRKLWPGLTAIVASALYSALVFGRLPERVVSHWDLDGTPNGWSSRGSFVLGMLVLEVGVALAIAYAPRFDPRRSNFVLHEDAYWLVGNAALVLVAAGTAFAIGINAGLHASMDWVGYGMAVFLIVMGNVFTRVRPNWIFGVRTPWTLSSDRSWRETHRFAGYGLVGLGLLLLLVKAVHPTAFMTLLLPGVLTVSVASILRSYFVWKDDTSTLGHE